jgi:hypothetical protein
VFLSAKNSPCGPHPVGLTPNIEFMKHSKHTGGRPPLGKARKQEYRITLRLVTSINYACKHWPVLPDVRAPKFSAS